MGQKKVIKIEGYTKSDGTVVPPHSKTVEVNDPQDKITAERIKNSIKQMESADAHQARIDSKVEELSKMDWKDLPSILKYEWSYKTYPNYDDYAHEADYLLTGNGLDKTSLEIESWTAEYGGEVKINDTTVNISDMQTDYLPTERAEIINRIKNRLTEGVFEEVTFPTHDHSEYAHGYNVESPLFAEGNEVLLQNFLVDLKKDELTHYRKIGLDNLADSLEKIVADPENIIEKLEEWEGEDAVSNYRYDIDQATAEKMVTYDTQLGGVLAEVMELRKQTLEGIDEMWSSQLDYYDSEEYLIDRWSDYGLEELQDGAFDHIVEDLLEVQ